MTLRDGRTWRKVSYLQSDLEGGDLYHRIAIADAESGNGKTMYETAYGRFTDLHPEEPNKVRGHCSTCLAK